MESIYAKYVHKSRIFCYPQLGIPRNLGYSPEQTYAACSSKFSVADMKLTLVYKDCMSSKAQYILKKYVYPSPILAGFEELPNETLIAWFDFSKQADDWEHFLNGRYSRFSKPWKKKLLSFYSGNQGNWQVMNKMLHPYYYHDEIAKLFNVPISIIRETREIIDKPDFCKEEYQFNEHKELTTL